MVRWFVAAVMMAIALPAMAEELVPVPFVGCAADGQQGYKEPPKSGPTPSLPKAAADRLAYYRGPYDAGVLAPRGWRCALVYGSDGSLLTVMPANSRDIQILHGPGIMGPVVALNLSWASTSGRFTVASIAGPLFPVANKFVQDVLHEPDTNTRLVSIANDKLTRRSDTVVEFTTPPNKRGLGTVPIIAPGNLPVSGVAILLTEEDMNLLMVQVRLPEELRDMTSVIIGQKIKAVGDCKCSSDK